MWTLYQNKRLRRDTIRKTIETVVCLCIAIISMMCYACAASAADIQAEIDIAEQKQQEAHQIAEYVRGFGETDNHPAIQFAKEKWQEQKIILDELLREYEVAKRKEEYKGTYIGTFRISHYCPCSICNGGYAGTAVGAPLTPWYTIAVDPSVIRLNSTVYIDGYGTFKAQDTGGAIKGNRIDVCVSSHSEAMQLGIVYKDVYAK